MSAELLRRAAALMRERAEAATPGPWRTDVLSDVVADHDDVSWDVADVSVLCPWPSATEHGNAAHIASWHPTVALAVADLLDAVALVADHYPPIEVRPQSVANYALAVARAYLGEES